MSYESNCLTFIGNLTDNPTLRFTPAGTPVANLTVANNSKRGDDEITTFMDVTVWRDQAENVAESLHKGDRVVVIGNIKKRSYEKDGQTRWAVEIDADEVCPSLKWARAQVSKSGGSQRQTVPAGGVDDDVPF